MTPEQLFTQEIKEARVVKHLEPISSDDQNPRDSNVSYSCRICYNNDSTEQNPCIVPCKCSGSVLYVHYKCLKNWLEIKKQSRDTQEYTTLFWKNFECEICKFGYPYVFRVENRIYKLVEINRPKPGSNYMILESLPTDRNTSRTIHVLQFNQNKPSFSMGRGHESVIRVNDISVSRLHAVISYLGDGFYLQDNNSKFGTLVLMKENKFCLETDKNYMF